MADRTTYLRPSEVKRIAPRLTSGMLAVHRHRGTGPAYSQPDGPGRAIFYRVGDVLDWLDRNRVEPETPDAAHGPEGEEQPRYVSVDESVQNFDAAHREPETVLTR